MVLCTDTLALKQGCHSSKCKFRYEFLASGNDVPDFDANEEELAKLYLSLHPKMWSKKINNNLVIHMFQPDTNVYHVDFDEIELIKSINGEFMAQINAWLDIEFAMLDQDDKNAMKAHFAKCKAIKSILKVKFVRFHDQ